MAAPTIVPYTNSYKFGRGRMLFNKLVDGIYQGFRPLGNCPDFNIAVEGEKFEHPNSESGIETIDLTVTKRVTRTANITCDNMSDENLALFLAGEVATISQEATPVTDEAIASVTAGRVYQLGATSSNPAGVRGVSSVAVRIKNGDDAAARANSTAYAVGALYQPATPNDHWYAVTVAGTSAGTPPTFTTDGTTFTDGTATVKDMGLIEPANTSDADWLIDEDLALLSVVEDGAIADAITALQAIDATATISLHADYTPAANSRTQIRTADAASVTGQLKFLADNSYGENQDVFLPSVTLTPSGELPFITSDNVGAMSIEVGINELNSTTKAIYVDGRPVAA